MKRKGILVCGIMLSALAVGLSGCGKQQGKDASEVAQGNVQYMFHITSHPFS